MRMREGCAQTGHGPGARATRDLPMCAKTCGAPEPDPEPYWSAVRGRGRVRGIAGRTGLMTARHRPGARRRRFRHDEYIAGDLFYGEAREAALGAIR